MAAKCPLCQGETQILTRFRNASRAWVNIREVETTYECSCGMTWTEGFSNIEESDMEMAYKDASLQVLAKSTDQMHQHLATNLAAPKYDHPLLWHAAENLTAHRYHRETGLYPPKMASGVGFDWSSLLQWLAKNLPSIIAFLLTIFAVVP